MEIGTTVAGGLQMPPYPAALHHDIMGSGRDHRGGEDGLIGVDNLHVTGGQRDDAKISLWHASSEARRHLRPHHE